MIVYYISYKNNFITFIFLSDRFTKFNEASPFMVVPLAITAVISLLLGLFPNQFPNFFELATRVASAVFGGGGL